MPQIKKLDPALVNKIAAGEVIERPASIVKELLENALDAGATRIDVALEEGGTRLIRVTDDGHGIDRDDLPLAVAAHATSKIYTDDDLFNIRSLGFRGEALASVAAVSHLRISSRPADRIEACELTASDGEPARCRPCAGPAGTTVEVRNLFYNVPARRKFLRRPQTEVTHATEQLARLALAHPQVAFTLTHNGRTARNLPAAAGTPKRRHAETPKSQKVKKSKSQNAQTPESTVVNPQSTEVSRRGSESADVSYNESFSATSAPLREPQNPQSPIPNPQSPIPNPQSPIFNRSAEGGSIRNPQSLEARRTRIGDFYGAELAGCLIPIDKQERGVRIEALIAPPDQSRASTKWQYFFLNGRFITDRRIGYAVREAFRGLVEHDRFPVVFLFLTTEPDQFDVNVHPTKIEVRWRDAGLIQSQILAVLRETLLSRDLTPRLRTPAQGDSAAAPADSLHQQRARHALADYLKSIDPTQARLDFQPPRFPSHSVRPSIRTTFATPPGDREDRDAPATPPHHRPPETGAGLRPPGAATGPADPGTAGDSTDPDMGMPDPQSPIPNPQSPIVNPQLSPDRSMMQIHHTYIVAQTDEGIVIIDQHALHERILYEKFRERILAGPLEAQGLLIPQPLEVSPRQAQAAEKHRGLLLRLGIEMSAFGPAALAVQTFPTLLHDVEIGSFVADLLDKLAEPDRTESEETLLHAALDMMACKAAVKAGDPLGTDEMQALLAQRHLTEKSSNCPHGRPTALQLSTRDLDKQFKRI